MFWKTKSIRHLSFCLRSRKSRTFSALATRKNHLQWIFSKKFSHSPALLHSTTMTQQNFRKFLFGSERTAGAFVTQKFEGEARKWDVRTLGWDWRLGSRFGSGRWRLRPGWASGWAWRRISSEVQRIEDRTRVTGIGEIRSSQNWIASHLKNVKTIKHQKILKFFSLNTVQFSILSSKICFLKLYHPSSKFHEIILFLLTFF